MIIDAHCHVGQGWYEPLEALQFHMDRNNVQRAVLVQIWNELDNSYQEACVAANPDRFASVVMVDAREQNAPTKLKDLVGRGAHGVRFRPSTRSPGDDPWQIWRVAADLGTTVSCVGSPADFASEGFADIVQAFPSLPIVVEHIGEIQPLSPEYSSQEADKILSLAKFSNVYMKFHGFGEYAKRVRNPGDGFPFERPLPDLLRRAYMAFGAARLMWGSDYPPVSRREGYANSLNHAREELADLKQEELDLIFGGVAEKMYWPEA